MKTVLVLLAAVCLSGCVYYDPERVAHLASEQDFHSYDQEYVSDCLYYEDLICDFER